MTERRVQLSFLLCCILISAFVGGCSTIRVTDPFQTATQQFLMTGAAAKAIDKLSAESLRDRPVFVDTSYLSAGTPPQFEIGFFIAEVRARLLKSGVRLMKRREDATIVLEIRAGGLSVDRTEFLLGIPSFFVP